jgi:hypothetical protein
MRRPANWTAQQQTPVKKHRPQSSITRSIKQLIESPSPTNAEQQSSSYPNMLTPTSSASASTITYNNSVKRTSPKKLSFAGPLRKDSDDSSWDVIDDLPLRWATDYVPLASSGSRLVNISVLFYDLWREDARRIGGGTTLAVATKTNIFLYETVKGERAFRFVKVCIFFITKGYSD